MSEIKKKVLRASEYIKSIIKDKYDTGIILGTGLGKLADNIEIELTIEYKDIPEFPISTVESHKGRLLFGKIADKKVVAMQGRFHYYEGYSLQEIALPIRVLRELGINTLFMSNACGTLNPYIRKSDIMIIDDHINLLGTNPLIGEYDSYFGPRFVDMSEPYSQKLISLAEDIALKNNIKLHKGIYAVMSGPSLETRAEYRFLRTIGADVVGMSTVPECITARQMGVKVFATSIITDECYPDSLQPCTLEDILKAADIAIPKLTLLFSEMIKSL